MKAAETGRTAVSTTTIAYQFARVTHRQEGQGEARAHRRRRLPRRRSTARRGQRADAKTKQAEQPAKNPT
jgi:hypothetical protein